MKVKDERHHPERENDEVFLTNTDNKGYGHIGWKTKREGVVAYDIYGGTVAHLFPVFIKKEEVRKKDPGLLKKLEP